MKKVKVIQVKSKIGRTPKQKKTLEGLGLRRIGQSRVHTLNPQIQGMINKVDFLVNVEEVS